MKVAILGEGFAAIKMANFLSEQGAWAHLFHQRELSSLISLNNEVVSIQATVKRFHKRFIGSDEVPSSGTRMTDLFRVVYSVDPQKNILKQVTENAEVFAKLGDEVVSSLKEHIEAYKDFDIVVDARDVEESSKPIGPGQCLALNEAYISKNSNFFYGPLNLNQFLETLDGSKKVAIVGDGDDSLLALEKTLEWLAKDKENHLSIISTGLELYSNVSEELRTTKQKVQERIEELWQVEFDKFQIELEKWRNLESFEKTKVFKPVEPKPQVFVGPGYNVTAVDKLMDQEGVFLTLEAPAFRRGEEMLRTIGVDSLYVVTGYFRDDLELITKEPGQYRLQRPVQISRISYEASLDDRIEKIWNDILSFFSEK